MTIGLSSSRGKTQVIREAGARSACWFSGTRQGRTAPGRVTTVRVAPAAVALARALGVLLKARVTSDWIESVPVMRA